MTPPSNSTQGPGNVVPFPLNPYTATAEAAPLPSNPFGGGDGGDGMDAWQTSVEKRLDSLDRHASSIETGVGDMRERLVRVETKVEHLPSKGYIDARLLVMLAVIAALIAFGDQLRALIH